MAEADLRILTGIFLSLVLFTIFQGLYISDMLSKTSINGNWGITDVISYLISGSDALQGIFFIDLIVYPLFIFWLVIISIRTIRGI